MLRSIVKLTEKPDVRAFELALLATLTEIVSAKTIRLCKIHESAKPPSQKVVVDVRVSDEEPLGDDASLPTLLIDDAAFLECLAKEEKVVASIGLGPGVRIVHPVKAESKMVGFLVIECEADIPRDQELVSIMLGFYKNYVSLLTHTQRDKLTGLLNGTTFDDKLLKIITAQRVGKMRASDGKGLYYLAMLDIDHFKAVNDKFGHLYGDEVLLLFGRVMVDTFRDSDLLFRVGGEEFVVVLRDVDLAQAVAILDRFRLAIERYPFPQIGKLTTSIGATIISGEDLPASIIDRADKALYYGKNNGRNQLWIYENLIAEGKLKVAKDDSSVELF